MDSELSDFVSVLKFENHLVDKQLDLESVHDPKKNPLVHSTEISLDHFISAGVEPIGPVCLWPQARHLASLNGAENSDKWDTREEVGERIKAAERMDAAQATKVNATRGAMLQGLVKSATQAVRNGKVSPEIREERWATCQACPALIKSSNRCSDCGCFMQAKTWIAGNPDHLCPRQKWSR